jgi:hypothetical protein
VIQTKDFLMEPNTDLDFPKKMCREAKCLFRHVPAAHFSAATGQVERYQWSALMLFAGQIGAKPQPAQERA